MKEIRSSNVQAESNETALHIKGTPIVFDVPTTIHDPNGDYIEIIKKGALEGADMSDSRLLYDHSTNRVPLAKVPKTMQFTVTDKALEMTAELPNTEDGKSVYEAVKRGDLTGMSFAFTIPEGGDRYDAKTNTRTITKIAKVYEVSIVPFPAYESTSVSVESRNAIEAEKKRYKAKQNLKIMCNKILMKEGK